MPQAAHSVDSRTVIVRRSFTWGRNVDLMSGEDHSVYMTNS